MKILLIRSNPVSPDPRVEKTANSLIKAGHDCHILAWDREGNYNDRVSIKKLQDSEVKITHIGISAKFGGGFKKNFKPLLKFQYRIIKWLINNKNTFDVIHSYDFDTGFISNVYAKIFRKKFVYDIPDYYVDSHNLKYTKIGKIISRLENHIINSAQAVIICTEKRKEQINGTKPSNLTIIHNSPAKTNLGNLDLKIIKGDSNKIKVVYVGVLSESRLLKEITEVISRRHNFEFHVAGFGLLGEYFINKTQTENNIYYYGKISYAEALALESQCDIMTAIYDPNVPNHYYAAPNKFYEALMLGKPLIMAENTGMDQVLRDEKLGEVIKFNSDSFNKALDDLILKSSDWINIGNRGKNLYNNHYSWSMMEKRLLDLYRKIE